MKARAKVCARLLAVAAFASLRATSAFAANEKCAGFPPLSEPFDIAQFRKKLQQRKDVDSNEKALCLLPVSIRKNFVLVNDSQSAQGGSRENPRALNSCGTLKKKSLAAFAKLERKAAKAPHVKKSAEAAP